MKTLGDKKQMFLDMLEHPERFTDQQLEVMMNEIDRLPDAEEAWEKTHPQLFLKGRKKSTRMVWRKVAAVFVTVIILGGLAWAIRPLAPLLSPHKGERIPEATAPLPTREGQGGGSVCFDNMRLDSLLTVVSAHYKRKLCLDNDTTGGMRLTTVWTPARPLAEFIETLNEFDGLRLTERNDTLFVESIAKEEGK